MPPTPEKPATDPGRAFTGDVAETRAKFHDNPNSMYGRTVDGAVLGDPKLTPPAGTVPDAKAGPKR